MLATNAKSQELRPGVPTPSSDSWWGTGWLWGEDETVDFVQIAPREPLGWGESYVSCLFFYSCFSHAFVVLLPSPRVKIIYLP